MFRDVAWSAVRDCGIFFFFFGGGVFFHRSFLVCFLDRPFCVNIFFKLHLSLNHRLKL